MSDGGIYKGPYGEQLYGSGRQVHPQQVSTTVPLPAEPTVVSDTQTPDYVTCSTCMVKSLYDSWSKNNWKCPWCNRQPLMAVPECAQAEIPPLESVVPTREKLLLDELCKAVDQMFEQCVPIVPEYPTRWRLRDNEASRDALSYINAVRNRVRES